MTDSPSPLTWDVIERWLAGACSAEETEHVEAMLAAHPDASALVATYRESARDGVPVFTPDDVSAAIAAVHARIGGAQSVRAVYGIVPSGTVPHTPSTNRPTFGRSATVRFGRTRLWTFAGAAVAIVLAIGLYARGTARRASREMAVVTGTYVAPPGGQTRITLGDGSKILLGPASRVVVREARDGARTADVSGQALFTVAHDSRTTFRVTTNQAIVQVLGTTFLVRRYPDEADSRVVVVEGRVSVRNAQRAAAAPAVLSAGTMAVVGDSSAPAATTGIVVEEYMAWTHGQLVFRRTPARQVAAELGRAYDVQIQADTTLGDQPLTWTVPIASRSLADVLDLFATLVDGHVVRSGSTITIVPGRKAVKTLVPDLPSTKVKYGR